MYLFLLFIAVPIIEIALFLKVGGLIHFWPTIGIVIITAILGTWLVRAQSAMALRNVQTSFSELQDPTEPLAHGAMILVSGVLLLTPGFLTDAVGFALLVAPIRRAAYRWLRSKIKVQSFSMGEPPRQSQQPNDQVIDGEFHEIDPKTSPNDKPSKWTDH